MAGRGYEALPEGWIVSGGPPEVLGGFRNPIQMAGLWKPSQKGREELGVLNRGREGS